MCYSNFGMAASVRHSVQLLSTPHTHTHTTTIYITPPIRTHPQAYQSCSTCLHAWSKPSAGSSKAVYDGYRQFLHVRSRARQQKFSYRGVTYEFKKIEHMPPSRQRNNQFVREACVVALERQAAFLGHKWMPLVALWPAFEWWRVNCPEMMHDVKNFVENFLQIIVGYLKDGFYQSWRGHDSRHRAECMINGVFPSVWDGTRPLPWRLTEHELQELHERTTRILWPSYVEP